MYAIELFKIKFRILNIFFWGSSRNQTRQFCYAVLFRDNLKKGYMSVKKKTETIHKKFEKDLSVAYFDMRNDLCTETKCQSYWKVLSRPLQNLAYSRGE